VLHVPNVYLQVRMDTKYERVFVRGLAPTLPRGGDWWLVGIRKLGESWLQLLMAPSEPPVLRGTSLGSSMLADGSDSGSFHADASESLAGLLQQEQEEQEDNGPFAAAAAAAADADEDAEDLMDADDGDAFEGPAASEELSGLQLQQAAGSGQRRGQAAGAGAVQGDGLYPVVSWSAAFFLRSAAVLARVNACAHSVHVLAVWDPACLRMRLTM
jgi:hypothetical protein